MNSIKHIYLVAIFVFCTNLFSQTYVSGIISSDTTWSISGSPYIIVGNTIVQQGVTLEILPGVEIRFDSLKVLLIQGTLISKGTNTDSIRFTANQSNPAAGYWGYIKFDDSSSDAIVDSLTGNYISGCILENTIVEYGGGIGNKGSIWIQSSHPFIKQCKIVNNSASGIYAEGITKDLFIKYCLIENNSAPQREFDLYSPKANGGGIYLSVNEGNVHIDDNQIKNNHAPQSTWGSGGGGIFVKGSGYIEIISNLIENNVADGASLYGYDGGGGIQIGGAGDEFRGEIYIKGNDILYNNTVNDHGNQGGGINLVSRVINGVIVSNNISFNQIKYRGGGIAVSNFVTSKSLIIEDNLISNNHIVGEPYGNIYYGGSGIYVNGDGIIKIFRNSINSNISSTSAIHFLGTYDTLSQFQHNTVSNNIATDSINTYAIFLNSYPIVNFNNIVANDVNFELWNNNIITSDHINAINNWWNTTNPTEIENKIYDFFDDGSLGIVDYNPFLLEPDTLAPIVGIKKDPILPAAFHLFQNYPNPFNPQTTIEFEITKPGNVKLIIYNSIGQKVKTLINQKIYSGNYSIVWDGCNDSGNKVSSGPYFYQLKLDDHIQTKKMIYLK